MLDYLLVLDVDMIPLYTHISARKSCYYFYSRARFIQAGFKVNMSALLVYLNENMPVCPLLIQVRHTNY